MAGNVKLMTSAGGGVVLDTATTTATDVTVKVPVTGVNNGTLVCSDSSGNVGISVTPSAWGATYKAIDLASSTYGVYNCGGGRGVGLSNNVYYNGTNWICQNGGYSAGLFDFNIAAGGAFAWRMASTSTTGQTVSWTQAMTLDSSGNLLVGTTSAGGYKCVIKGGDNNELRLDNDGSTSTGLFFANNGTDKVQCYWHNSLTRYYTVAVSGGVYLASGGTSWTSTSDERVKENLKPIENAVDKVSTLRAVTGNYISDEAKKSRAFLIAQDVEKVLPEAVDTTNPEELGLQYSDTIPLLVAAIKELSAKNDALEARLAALEAK